MTPAEVLRNAADLIEERGWWKGTLASVSPDGGRLCAAYAMAAVCDAGTSSIAAQALYNETRVALVAGLGRGWMVSDWNDAQPNGDAVIAKLREVAADLERAAVTR